jgi:hypothetical protein
MFIEIKMITLCPSWLAYVSRTIANPRNKSALPKTGPICIKLNMLVNGYKGNKLYGC